MNDSLKVVAPQIPERIRLDGGWLDLSQEEFVGASGAISLTTTEALLLRVLWEQGGEPVSRETLHSEVWGYSPKVHTRAADQTVKRLRKKLEENPANPRHLMTAHGIGYRFLAASRQKGPGQANPVSSVPTNLPQHSIELVGRETLFSRIGSWLQGESQIATLLGPGGIGKTAAARSFGGSCGLQSLELPGGIWFSDLGSASLTSLAMAKVARDIGLRLPGTVDAESMGRAIHARGPMLLILDNLETVPGPLGKVLEEWARAAPGLRLLTTSRVRLDLAGEQCIEVPPLTLDASTILLRDRISAVSDRRLDTEDLTRLSEALEGIPLAIELAAARCSLLSPAELSRRMYDALDVLVRSKGDPEDRHATLRASLKDSWDSLKPTDQDMLAQCTVFRGDFDLEAAEEILIPTDPQSTILAHLQRLRDHSLLRVSGDTRQTRVSLLSFVRAFVAEQPAKHDVLDLQMRHARLYVRRYDACNLTNGLNTWSTYEHIAPDLENLRVAAERAGQFPDGLAVRTLTARSSAIVGRGLADEATAYTMEAFERLKSGTDVPLEAAVVAWSRVAIRTLDQEGPEVGIEALRRARDLARRGNAYNPGIRASVELAQHLFRRNQTEEAHQILFEARTTAANSAPELEGLVLHEIGQMFRHIGRREEADQYAEEALALWTRQGDRVGVATAHWALGFLRLESGELQTAESHFQAAIEAFEEVRDGRAPALHSLLGLVALERGALDQAEEILGSSMDWCRQTGALNYLAEDLLVIGLVTLLQGRHGECLAHLSSSDKLYEQLHDKGHHLETRVMMAMALALTGDWRAAKRQLKQCESEEDFTFLPEQATLQSVANALIDLKSEASEAASRAIDLVASLNQSGRRTTFVARAAVKLLAQASKT